MSSELEAKIRHAPRSPGVYLMKDGAGEILYVGKARDLKARIRAYFARTDAPGDDSIPRFPDPRYGVHHHGDGEGGADP